MTAAFGIAGIVILFAASVAWRISTQRTDHAIADFFDAFGNEGFHDGEDNQ